MSEKNKGLGARFTAIIAKYTGNVIVALDLTLADGSGMLTFPDLKDGEIPKEGDKAKVGEKDAEGEVTVLIEEKPVIYLFEAGVFKGIKPEGEPATEAETALKAKITELEQKLSEVTSKFTALEGTHKEAVQEFTALAREVVSGKSETEVEKFFTKETEVTDNVTAMAKLEALKKKKGII